MKAKFTGALRVEILKEPIDGKWFVSVLPFRYISGKGKMYDMPTGIHTDFGSVPRGLRWLVPRIGKYNFAAFFHDWLCEYKIVSRKEADDLFLEAMEACGLSKLKRSIRYFGVRAYSIVRRLK